MVQVTPGQEWYLPGKQRTANRWHDHQNGFGLVLQRPKTHTNETCSLIAWPNRFPDSQSTNRFSDSQSRNRFSNSQSTKKWIQKYPVLEYLDKLFLKKIPDSYEKKLKYEDPKRTFETNVRTIEANVCAIKQKEKTRNSQHKKTEKTKLSKDIKK